MFSALGGILVYDHDFKCLFLTTSNELDNGKKTFITFEIYYLHKPENLSVMAPGLIFCI